MTDELAYINS